MSEPTEDQRQETGEIIASIWDKLPAVAKDVIEKNLDLSDERNRSFFDNPDDPSQHETNWHQWGILTHTKMFDKFYREEIPSYLDQWGMGGKVRDHLSEEIDGISKGQLLNLSIPLHDLGKFAVRKFNIDDDGAPSVSFRTHEITSGEIIRSPEFSGMLKQDYGLTEAQIEYLARCAELHYVLGVVRDEVKKSVGYTFAYARSDSFRERSKELMAQNPGFQLEIGLLFLADSIAKTDIRIKGDNDEQIESQDSAMRELLQSRGLNPKLVRTVKQLPVNRAIAENYLKTWAEAN